MPRDIRMRVLIDGYNLLHAARGSHWGDSDLSRYRLCRLLGAWAEQRGHLIRIVFDGEAISRDLAVQLSGPRVEVVHSGARIADELLAEMLQADSGARDVWVVSSDHAVQRSAKQRDAQYIDAEAFAARLNRELSETRRSSSVASGEKPAKIDEGERQAWLAEFGFESGERSEPFDHP